MVNRKKIAYVSEVGGLRREVRGRGMDESRDRARLKKAWTIVIYKMDECQVKS